MYRVKIHVDESINGWTDGWYTWGEAWKRAYVLLRTYPSVTVDTTRLWAVDL